MYGSEQPEAGDGISFGAKAKGVLFAIAVVVAVRWFAGGFDEVGVAVAFFAFVAYLTFAGKR